MPQEFFVGNGDFPYVQFDPGKDYQYDFSGVGYRTADLWSSSTFGTPVLGKDGKVVAVPGSAAYKTDRWNILSLQKKILEVFGAPQFLEAVKKEAQKMGHVFNGKVVAPKNPILAPYTGTPYALPPKTFLETFEDIDKLIKKAKNSPEKEFLDLVKDLDGAEKGTGGKTAANFEKLKAALLAQNGKADAAVTAFAMVNAIYEARKQDKISTYEIRKLLIETLASTDPSTLIAQRLLELSEKSNSFKRAFAAADNFKASNASTTYEVLIKILKNSKGCNITVLGI